MTDLTKKARQGCAWLEPVGGVAGKENWKVPPLTPLTEAVEQWLVTKGQATHSQPIII